MVFEENELVFYKKDGNIQSGGYNVNSILLKSGKSPMITSNSDVFQKGGGKSDPSENLSALFKDLAIPMGVFYMQDILKEKSYPTEHKEEVIKDSLYDKLLNLASTNSLKTKKHYPRKKNHNESKNKTKKRK